ncbi:MAG: contractile injection system tape measure protein [Methylobacter tundripaludum]|nr:contractile injection system tape measure protein [Methylobacter tundripaludum]
MDTQRHVIKRQIVEITLAKQENAWQIQQTLSRIFQQQLPLLDRCLSEASSSDCLHRIERLELNLGELDGNRLEAELSEKIEAALRLALSEQIAPSEPVPVVAKQQIDPVSAHLELLDLFIREGYLPWWAEISQRQLPEKSFAVLIETAPHALKRLLPKLIQEQRSRQRLVGYFDDNNLVVMMALLCSVPQTLVASLLQTLLVVQAQFQQSSRVSRLYLRASLWQSLLQVAIAGDPLISQQAEFLTAVIARWARLQGLSHQILVNCVQQLASSQNVTNNEWRPAALSASIEQVASLIAEEATGNSSLMLHPAPSDPLIAAPKTQVKEPLGYRHRLKKIGGDANYAQQNTNEPTLASSATQQVTEKSGFSEEWVKNDTAYDNVDYQRGLTSIGNRYPLLKKMGGDYAIQAQKTVRSSLTTKPFAHEFAQSPVAKTPSAKNGSVPEGEVNADTTEDSVVYRHRLASTAISNRYSLLKKIGGARQGQKTANETAAENIAIKQSEHKAARLEEQADIETIGSRQAFSDTDALYINNAGLCLLWPYLASFFERLELVRNGRFHDQAAKQYAVRLLHYLAAEDLEPPEYLLPFNKLLCAMEIDEVFDSDSPLTTAHIEACDELLAAVIDNAPILNTMSVNGFRGSFLLREGSLSASEGSWLLRVERKTYDVVLERFPWSWQWFKLPWMEHPFRVEW